MLPQPPGKVQSCVYIKHQAILNYPQQVDMFAAWELCNPHPFGCTHKYLCTVPTREPRTIDHIAKPTNSRTSGAKLSTKHKQKMGGQGDPIKLRVTILITPRSLHTCFSKACGTKRRSSIRQLLILSRRRFSITCAKDRKKRVNLEFPV